MVTISRFAHNALQYRAFLCIQLCNEPGPQWANMAAQNSVFCVIAAD